MSISGLVGASRTHTNTNDYDHAINLIDATEPAAEREEAEDTSRSKGASLSRKWTKDTLREELVRRKYAKWQEGKLNDEEEGVESNNDDENDVSPTAGEGGKGELKKTRISSSRLHDKIPFRSKKRATQSKTGDDTYVDILYENQRGWFLCGIPLYSSKSLLPIDPPSWQTGAFRESPVNITNAQLPDPSWGWAWRRWYVDMSYDVDEEGWQYSFNFYRGYAWHGTHPWFHSFVRRRRWLRKRTKIHPTRTSKDLGMLKQAHLLNEDYFTIHAARERSRESSLDRTTKRSSFKSMKSDSSDDYDTGEITDTLKLMAALRNARIDREKMAVVRKFIDQGGDDLVYFGDKMQDIMHVFVYRTSQLQLYAFLQQALENVDKQIQKTENGAQAEYQALKKKSTHLAKAIEAARTYLSEVNFLNNSKDSSDMAESNAFPTKESTSEESTDLADEIKGIPGDADIAQEPGVRWDNPSGQGSEASAGNKGKGKA